VRTLPASLRMVLTAFLPRIWAFFFLEVGHTQVLAGDKLMKLKHRNYFYNLPLTLFYSNVIVTALQIEMHARQTCLRDFHIIFYAYILLLRTVTAFANI